MRIRRSSLVLLTAWLHCGSGSSFLLYPSSTRTYHDETLQKYSRLRAAVQPSSVEAARKRTSQYEDAASSNDRQGVPVKEFPYCVSISPLSSNWIHQAAFYLREHGVCVLTHDDNGAVVDPSHCQLANEAAIARLSTLKHLIREEKGMDPTSGGPFRFREVVSRDDSGGRYDMPVPWQPTTGSNNDHDKAQVSLTQSQSKAISSFHQSLEQTIQPIMDILWGKNSNNDNLEKKNVVAASGFLINQPGSTDQTWHRDGPVEGWINVFCPLVDLTMDMGPTQVWPNTHLSIGTSSPKMAPLLKRGQVLLMDYRTFHRGLGNYCNNNPKEEAGATRTVAYAVYNRGASASLGDKLSYGLLPQAYPSIIAASNTPGRTGSSREIESRLHVQMDANDNDDQKSWVNKAVRLLQQEGICVMDSTSSSSLDDLLNAPNTGDVRQQVLQRLDDLIQRVRNRGMNPDHCDEPFEFLEVSRQAPGRYTLPSTTPLNEGSEMPTWEAHFHSKLRDTVQPVLNKLWNGNNDYHLASSGFRVHQPGSSPQQWHRDNCEPGSVHVICPLTTNSVPGHNQRSIMTSPIEVWPRSHDAAATQEDDTAANTPVLPAWRDGQVLLMDHRMLYQYLENTSDREETWGYSVWRQGPAPAGGHVRPGAMTLEYD